MTKRILGFGILAAALLFCGNRVVNHSGGDITPPTLVSMVIPGAGTSITVNINELGHIGTGGGNGLVITMSGGASTVGELSGTSTTAFTGTLSRTVNSGETGTGTYTQPGNGIEDMAGNDLATFTSQTVTNESTQPGWAEHSVVFDGSTNYLQHSGDLTGDTDAKTGTISMWVRWLDHFNQYSVIQGDPTYFTYQRTSSDFQEVAGLNSSSTAVLDATTTAALYENTPWHHYIISWDLSVPTVLCYVDNSPDALGGGTFIDTLNGILHTQGITTTWNIGQKGDGTHRLYAKMCELYYSQSFVDLTNATKRAWFYTVATSKPAGDLLTTGAPSPLIYFKTSQWASNSGTGGTFTVYGTLADGGADKP